MQEISKLAEVRASYDKLKRGKLQTWRTPAVFPLKYVVHTISSKQWSVLSFVYLKHQHRARPATPHKWKFNSNSNNTQDGARLDIAMNGFWGSRHERSFCDVRAFNPYAPSNSNHPLAQCYRKHEREKKNRYERQIRDVEHASFTPLIFSATGGTRVFYKRLAALLANKWGNNCVDRQCPGSTFVSFSLY